MKRIFNKIAFVLLGAAVGAGFVSCTEEDKADVLPREFTPYEFTKVIPTTGGVTLAWAPVKTAAGYNVEIATDSSVTEIVLTEENIPEYEHSFGGLDLVTSYVARVCAVSKNPAVTGNSGWMLSKEFKTKGRDIPDIISVNPHEVTETAAVVRWSTDDLAKYPVDQILWSADGRETWTTIEVADQTAGQMTLTDLPSSRTITVKGHDKRTEGQMGDYNEVTFRTKDVIQDAVDVAIGADLASAIASAPEGAPIRVAAGGTYNLDKPKLTKNLHLIGASSLSGEVATVSIREMDINGEITYIKLENLRIDGTSLNNLIVFTASFKGLQTLEIRDCEIFGYARGILRHNGTDGTGMEEVIMDNCLVHSSAAGQAQYALFAFADKNRWCKSYTITNCTFYDIYNFFIDQRGVQGTDLTADVTLRNCTFNNMLNDASKYFIDLRYMAGGSCSIENVFFGKTMNGEANGFYRSENISYTVRNSYKANDFKFKEAVDSEGNPVVASDAKIPLLNAASTEIFKSTVDPVDFGYTSDFEDTLYEIGDFNRW